MRNIIMVILMSLIPFVLHAQFIKDKSHNYEIMGGWGNTDISSADKTSPEVSAAYIFNFNKFMGLGAGLSYNKFELAPMDGGTNDPDKCNVWSVYGSIRGYIPTYSKHITFVGVFNVGGSFFSVNGADNPNSESFVYSPQLGVKINLFKDKKLAINARGFYKRFTKIQTNIWGVLFGLSF